MLLKVTAQQFYSHGDGTLPARGNDSDEAGEDGRVDVVLHGTVVVGVPGKPLDPPDEDKGKRFESQCGRQGDLRKKRDEATFPVELTLDVWSSASSVYWFQRTPSSLYSRAYEMTYISLPRDLAPCVTMPVIFLTWDSSICNHWFTP